MRGYLPRHELKAPRDLADALSILKSEPGRWRPFAGGTDLMVLFEAGALPYERLLSLWNLKELRGIDSTDTILSIGALTTYSDIRASALLRRELPLLVQAASETGAIAIQNRGTIGGNIANASPAADSPPALLAYDAEVELVSAAGTSRIAYSDFHLGYKKTALAPEELIARVLIPKPAPGLRQYYRKVGTRKAQAISKVCFAGAAELGPRGQARSVRIALGSIAATPVRARATEALLTGRSISCADPGFAALVRDARDALAREISPIDDIRSTGEYRARVACNLLEEFLRHVGLDLQA